MKVKAIGLGKNGTYADYVTIPATYIAPKPGNIIFEEAASCWMQFITAYDGLIEAGKLKPVISKTFPFE